MIEKENQFDKFSLFVRLYGISTIVGYLMPNPLLYKIQFYFNLFSLA